MWGGSGNSDPRILHLGTNCRWLVSIIALSLFITKFACRSHWAGGWLDRRTSVDDAEYDNICSLLLELVPRFPVTYQSTVWATPALSLTIFNTAIPSALQRVYLFHQQGVPTFGTKLLPPSPCSDLCRLTLVSDYIAAAQWAVEMSGVWFDWRTKINVKILQGLILNADWTFTDLCAVLSIILLRHWHIQGLPWPYIQEK
jgi:hypothetical protein